MPSIPNAELLELLEQPRESLDIEIKEWLSLSDDIQRADLCKAIIALANHGGGFLVIGFEEHPTGQFAPSSKRPPDLSGLSQDAIQDAIQKYLEPPVQCRTVHLASARGQFPIVVVPGGTRVPVKAKRGSPDGKLVKDRVYIRRPGPRSEEPQNAAEWDQLFERCLRARREELLAGIRDLLSGDVPVAAPQAPDIVARLSSFIAHSRSRFAQLAAELPKAAPSRFPDGYYEVAMAIDGSFEIPDLQTLRDTMKTAVKSHSGWPPFVSIEREPYRPRPVDDTIEVWLGQPDADGSFRDTAHGDFWRVSPEGFFYIRRGYNEDGGYRDMVSHTALDITTPTWRLGETILEAFYVSRSLGVQDGNLLINCRWTGLRGRKLVSVGNPNRMMFNEYKAHQDTYDTQAAVELSALPGALPEIVFKILAPLYQLFDFWQLPKRLVEEELQNLQRHRY